MTGCPNSLSFNIPAVAGLYSQLSGVLAGFAFTTLAVLVGTRVAPGSAQFPLASVVRILLAAFLALIVTSMGFAILSGDQESAGRAATQQTAVGAAFGVSITLLFFSIISVLDEVRATEDGGALQAAANFVRLVLSQGITVLVTFYVYASLDDYQDARYGLDRGWSTLDLTSLGTLAALVPYNFFGYRRFVASPWSEAARAKAVAYLSTASVVAVFIFSAIVGTTSSLLRTPCSSLPLAYEYANFFLVVALMMSTTYVAGRSRT